MNKKKEIKQRVEQILFQHQVEEPPVPVEQIAQKIGLEIRYEPLRQGSISGLLHRSDDITIIGVNSLDAQRRQRFTIAHELGHFCLHSEKELYIDKGFKIHLRDDKSSQAVAREEIEANQFAAELLMPEALIRNALHDKMIDIESDEDLIALAKLFEVSAQALMFRLANLKLY